MASAFLELGLKDGWENIVQRMVEENRIEVASRRQRKVGPKPAVVLMKCMVNKQ